MNNEEIGNSMTNKLKIAFDVDDTLIIPSVASNGAGFFLTHTS